MKFLTIDYIKRHSRIDFDCEDAELELYGAAAENTVLATVRRTIDNVRDMNDGKIPPEYYHLALMLTNAGYEHRSPTSTQNHSIIPYTFDIQVKPLMRLDERTDLQAERDTLLEKVNALYTDIAIEYMPTDYERHTEEEYEAYNDVVRNMVQVNNRYAMVEKPTASVCARLRKEASEIKTKCDELLKTE